MCEWNSEVETERQKQIHGLKSMIIKLKLAREIQEQIVGWSINLLTRSTEIFQKKNRRKYEKNQRPVQLIRNISAKY